MTTAFPAGTVIDGTGAPPRERCTVVVDGDRIAAYGARDEVEMPPAAEVIEAPDATLIPGLALFLAVMSVNLLGDRLRQILDPRSAD